MKEFLSQRGVAFIERNVAQDETALAELEKLGFMTTPVTVIDSQVVIGFDGPKLHPRIPWRGRQTCPYSRKDMQAD